MATPVSDLIRRAIRALCAVDGEICWFGTGKGTIGRTVDGGQSWKHFVVEGAEEIEFRDVEAFDARRCLAMSVGEEAASRIYRTIDGGETWKLVYQNKAPKGFHTLSVGGGLKAIWAAGSDGSIGASSSDRDDSPLAYEGSRKPVNGSPQAGLFCFFLWVLE